MLRKKFQGRQEQPFVSLGTIRDMTALARKLAMMREAVSQIRKQERELERPAIVWKKKQVLRNIVDAADKAQDWSKEARNILRGIKQNAEGYRKGL